tara:strand:+ start:434 stop:646 length:213 start_codon:yes stop_codon:yes gene_type:complete
MPSYEYSCKRCSYQFTTYQSIKDEPLNLCGIHCPIQDLGIVKRLISKSFYVIFKGKGFYETDYKKKEVKK